MTAVFKPRFPFFTLTITLICSGLFYVFTYFTQRGETPEIYTNLGAPTAYEIYEGKYWGVLTNSFLHNHWLHLSANLLALWLFSAYIERRLEIYKLFMLGLFASVITSIWQLALSNDPGIGLSGVNFFLFAFILGKSNINTVFRLKFRYILLILFLIILGICYYQNIENYLNFGVEAMSAGLFFGYTIGWISEFRKKFWVYGIGTIIFIASVSTMFYAPWSYEWHVTKGIDYHKINDRSMAKYHYNEALKLDPGNNVARENLKKFRIDELSNLAYHAHEKGDYEKARYYYIEILKIHPNDPWALANMKKLP